MSKTSRKLGTMILIIVGIFAASVWFRGQPFDRTAWHDDARVRAGIRLQMADRLIARHTLKGMTRDEVLWLLGQPPSTDYFHDWDLVYWLGRERSYISIDSEWLVLRFGTNGRVSEVQIVRD